MKNRKEKLEAIMENPIWRYFKGYIKKIFIFIWKWKLPILFIIFIISIFFAIHTINAKKNQITKCGIVEDMKQITDTNDKKIQNIIYVRYGMDIEQHFVDDNLYYNSKKGEEICFDVMNPIHKNKLAFWLITAFVSIILFIAIGAKTYFYS